MTPAVVITTIILYFGVLVFISWLTTRNADSETFFTGNRNSPWYVVAYGMVGAALSGVTFVSVPGYVALTGFSYFQFVLGNFAGYIVILLVLLPLYYRLNLISIYNYLTTRFGFWSNKTGSFFFLISRTVQAAFRLFVIAKVLQVVLFDQMGTPFWLTILVTIVLIWIYTFRGGIKTIVWTDTLQTTFLLLAAIFTVWFISRDVGWSFGELVSEIEEAPRSQVFFFEDFRIGNNFFKQFIGGFLIAIAMIGLDQDMMQKNLTCRNIKDAQKNMFFFGLSFVVVSFLFLVLGLVLYKYAENVGFSVSDPDTLYPGLADAYFPLFVGILFLLGVIAAAYSSADSALTALTTSFSIDFLNVEKKPEKVKVFQRKMVHIGFSILLFFIILVFYYFTDDSIVKLLFTAAGYTYGPILGLFAFGLLTKRGLKDRFVPLIALIAPLLTAVVNGFSKEILWGYVFSYEIILVNGAFMFIGLWVISYNRRKRMEDGAGV